MKLIKLFLFVNKLHFGLELPAFFLSKWANFSDTGFIYRVSKEKGEIGLRTIKWY